jgi:hypothetical protein
VRRFAGPGSSHDMLGEIDLLGPAVDPDEWRIQAVSMRDLWASDGKALNWTDGVKAPKVGKIVSVGGMASRVRGMDAAKQLATSLV